MSRKSRYPRGESRRMRVIEGALIDEHGGRLDRDYTVDFSSLQEQTLQAASRLVQLDGLDAPSEITLADFQQLLRRLTPGDEPLIVRYTNPQETIVGIDVSDCPRAQ